jgi:hypothetical protein
VHVPIYCCPKKTIDKCLCCLSFHSEQQILSSSSHACLHRSKRTLQTEDMRRTDRKNAHNIFFVECAGRERPAQVGPGRAGLFVGFRCGFRTLWFLTSWTLCFLTLGWTLSPVTVYPRWACKSSNSAGS